MSGQHPFGFTPGSGDSGDSGSGSGGSGGSGSGGSGSDNTGPFGFNFGDGAPFFRELEKLLSWQGGPINWDLARQVANQAIAAGSQAPDSGHQRKVRESGRLADVWLNEATTLPGLVGAAEELASWSRSEWIERTIPVWQTICDPVADKVVDALGSGMSGGLAQLGGLGGADLSALNLPPGLELPQGMDLSKMLGDLAGPLTGMLRQMGGLLFGAQVGTALSALAGEVVGATDIGLPLGGPALLPHNVDALAEGLEVPPDEVLLFVALRELAHQRLYAHVPWLRSHVLGAIEDYARGIKVDPEALGRAVEQLDLSQFDPSNFDPSNFDLSSMDASRFDPERLSEVLGADAFTSPQTPEQQAALSRLETALALVEGWVDDVVMQAVAGRLPSAVALHEAVRRRRASGGPAEQTFAALVGLELRPRQARNAATLWKLVRETRGTEGRDAVWAHPDLLPDAEALADPEAFAAGSDDSMDPLAEIAKLSGEAPKEDAAGTRFSKEKPATEPGDEPDGPPQPA